jgi:hypothetical protein
MGLGVLVWAVPMVVMSGGLMEYIEVMRWWQYQHTAESASLYGTAEQVIRFGAYAVYSLGLGAIPLVVASARRLPGLVGSIKRNWGAQVLAAWTLPATVYLTIIHLRQPGHTFTIQPALLLLAGLAIVSLASRKGSFYRSIWIGVTAVVVIANALFFLMGPTYLFGDTRMLFTTPSWGAIRDYDEFVISRLDVIRERFARDETAVLASGRNFRLPDFYLSDFQLPSLSYEINRSPVTLSEPTNTLVFFDETALPGSSTDMAVQSVPLPDGDLLRYITWDESQVVEVGPGWLQIDDR